MINRKFLFFSNFHLENGFAGDKNVSVFKETPDGHKNPFSSLLSNEDNLIKWNFEKKPKKICTNFFRKTNLNKISFSDHHHSPKNA